MSEPLFVTGVAGSVVCVAVPAEPLGNLCFGNLVAPGRCLGCRIVVSEVALVTPTVALATVPATAPVTPGMPRDSTTCAVLGGSGVALLGPVLGAGVARTVTR